MYIIYTKRVTYQSIDNLLKTNEALAQFNMTSKQLDQSQKVLARTILVLQGSRNAFGDAQKTINSLSNQIRVFQGSLVNLRLALGDTFAEPFRKALIYVNGFIMAVTDIIRLFKPLTKETGNPLPDNNFFSDVNEELETTEKKMGLLDFDKFKVLSKGKDKGTTGDVGITEALTKELEKQQQVLKDVQKQMQSMTNQATEIAKKIKEWFVIFDENGGFKEWTNKAKILGDILGFIGANIIGITISKKVIGIVSSLKSIISLVGGISSKALGVAGVVGAIIVAIMIIYKVLKRAYETNEDFRNSVKSIVKSLKNTYEKLKPTLQILYDIIIRIFNFVSENVIELVDIFITELLTPIVELIAKIFNKLDEIGLLEPILGAMFLGIFYVAIKIYQQWDKIVSFIKKSAQVIKDAFVTIWKVIANSFARMINNIANGFISFVNYLADKINELLIPLNEVIEFFGGDKLEIPDWKASVNWVPYDGAYANGGIPNVGSMFVAGEAGAEIVGNIGGKTNVINMEQLQQAVARGMIMAINSTNLNQRSEIDVNFNIDPSEMARTLNPYINKDDARSGFRYG